MTGTGTVMSTLACMFDDMPGYANARSDVYAACPSLASKCVGPFVAFSTYLLEM